MDEKLVACRLAHMDCGYLHLLGGHRLNLVRGGYGLHLVQERDEKSFVWVTEY